MKKSRIKPIRKISKKRQEKLQLEAIQVKLLLEACKGRCMICGKWVGDKKLQKSHTRRRDRFILICSECHSPGGKHRYLDDKEVSSDNN